MLQKEEFQAAGVDLLRMYDIESWGLAIVRLSWSRPTITRISHSGSLQIFSVVFPLRRWARFRLLASTSGSRESVSVAVAYASGWKSSEARSTGIRLVSEDHQGLRI
jgi:hypothetical protein